MIANKAPATPPAAAIAPPLFKDFRRIGFVSEPPFEQSPRLIDGIFDDDEPGLSESRLKAESSGGPLRRAPGRRDDDPGHDSNLTDIDLCWKHSPPHSPAQCRRRDENGESAKPSIEIKNRASSERKIDQARTGRGN